MTCPHQSMPPDKDTGRRLCSLGRFGGRPWAGQCAACQRAGLDRHLIGDALERLAKPLAKALRLDCLDDADKLKLGSPCAKRRDRLNEAHAKARRRLTAPGN
jgi:hypothetical protein